MPKILLSNLTFLAIILPYFIIGTYAKATVYTLEQVERHDQANDCWMVFEQKVYDITAELNKHDQFMDIRDWCGRDMTIDFKTKAGEGKDHKRSTYNLLAEYYLGEIIENTIVPTKTTQFQSQITLQPNQTTVSPTAVAIIESSAPVTSRYELWIPLAVTSFLFWISFFLSRHNHGRSGYSLLNHNMIFNSIMLISLLPSALFGVFMVLRESFPELYKINFDFLWWHVEGSIIFTALVFSHFIQRSVQYRSQLKIIAKQILSSNKQNS